MSVGNIIVYIIILLAIIYVARKAYMSATGKGGCGCGSSSCSGKKDHGSSEKKKPNCCCSDTSVYGLKEKDDKTK